MPLTNKEERNLRAFNAAHQFLREFNLNWYPIDPIEIINKKAPKWKVASVEDLASILDVTETEAIAALLRGSKDGVTHYAIENEQYLIWLNADDAISFSRFRWTAMHEIGHIYLGHFTDNKVSYITENNPDIPPDEYEQLEKEANIFAGEVLASKWVMRSLDIFDENQIAEICGIEDTYALVQYQKATAGYEYEPPNVTVTKRRFALFKEEIGICKSLDDLRFPSFGTTNKAIAKLPKPIVSFLRKSGICHFCGGDHNNPNANFCIYCGAALKMDATKKTAPCGHINNGRAAYCEECGQKVIKIRRGYCAESEDEI